MIDFGKKKQNEEQKDILKAFQLREEVSDFIRGFFREYGCQPVFIPTILPYTAFSQISGTVLREEMFKLIDNEGDILVLRPDMTIPIARMVNESNISVDNSLKLYYISKVFRMKGNREGDAKEILQAGVEHIGDKSSQADGEIISIAAKLMTNCNQNFIIEIGHTEYFKSLISDCGLSNQSKEILKGLIENKNIPELCRFINSLDIQERYKYVLTELPNLYGYYEDIIPKARKLCVNKRMENALDNLHEIYEILSGFNCNKYLTFDLGLINHLDYYTGIVFRCFLTEHMKTIISGGRYDNLLENDTPATGFGLNLDILMKVLEDGHIG